MAAPWPTLVDQRGAVPLLSSSWSLPGGEAKKEQGLRWAWGAVAAGATEMWAFARADRRKIVYAAKFGLALSVVTLLLFLHDTDIAAHALWAIFTVLFIFEFSIGATLSKGFNRAIGTLTAVGLAIAVAELSKYLGQMEEVILIISTFAAGFGTNLARLHPKMIPYDYGFRVFLLTFYIVMVAGYNTGNSIDTAVRKCATLSKGFNRAIGTLTAVGLAIAVAELSKYLGQMEEVILIISTFAAGFGTNLARLHPKMIPYDYGFRVFLLTFYIVMVAGYNTGNSIDTAVSRSILVTIGAAVTLVINIGICPIWAGEDLHNLVAKNFAGVAKSLEGCVDGYLKSMEYGRIPSKILTYEASDDPLYSGYRTAAEASAKEESLLGFAIWEPPHGPYKMMSYPWKSFTIVGGALTHCAFAIMALHGCILSEIQAPPEFRRLFSSEIYRVGKEGAKVLCELGNNVKTMTKLRSSHILSEVHLAAEELQKKIDEKSYLLVNTKRWDTSKQAEGIKDAMSGTSVMPKENKNAVKETTLAEQTSARHYKSFAASSFLSRYDSSSTIYIDKTLLSWPARRSFHPEFPLEDEESKTYESASALSLATFSSLLIEFVARLQYVVNAFEELSEKVNFKEPMEEPVVVSMGDGGFLNKICKYIGPTS